MDLVEVVNKATDTFVEEFDDRMLSVELNGLTALPLVGDAEKLEWALWELLENAGSFTLPGGNVTLTVYKDEDAVKVIVADAGVGIEPSSMTRIFDQFYRGFPTKPDGTYIEVRGAGLGLFVAKQVVEAHEGEIRVESTPHEGSTFTIYLPLDAQRTPTPGPKVSG
jgi:signal transduction histidine kinase